MRKKLYSKVCSFLSFNSDLVVLLALLYIPVVITSNSSMLVLSCPQKSALYMILLHACFDSIRDIVLVCFEKRSERFCWIGHLTVGNVMYIFNSAWICESLVTLNYVRLIWRHWWPQHEVHVKIQHFSHVFKYSNHIWVFILNHFIPLQANWSLNLLYALPHADSVLQDS